MDKLKQIQVRNQQSIEDVALEHYGAVEGVAMLILDNREQLSKGFDTRLHASMELRVRPMPVNAEIKRAIEQLSIHPVSDPSTSQFIPQGPDFNPDYNLDYDTIAEDNE